MKADSIIIGVDFDGTIVENDFPDIGAPVPWAKEVLWQLVDYGHRVILWTCRSNYDLLAAIDYVRNTMGLDFHGWNSNRLGDEFPGSPKLYADDYIDDKGIGCPLVFPAWAPPYVDWPRIHRLYVGRGLLPHHDLGIST